MLEAPPTALTNRTLCEAVMAKIPSTTSPDIVELLAERRKLRYAGDCKCGKCCLVPHEMLCSAIDVIKRLRGAVAIVMEDEEGDLDFVKFQIRAALADGDA
jgi:hypothetical protein